MSAGVCDSAGRLSAWVHAAPAWQSIPLLGTAAARSHGRSSGRPGSRGGVRLSSVTVCVGFGHPCTGRMRMDAYACNSFLCLCVCVYLSLPPLHSHHYPLLPPPLSIGRQTIFKRVTTGARDDLERVTQMAYDQVMRYGMGKQVRPQPPSPPSSCSLLLSRPRPPPLLIFFFSVSCAHVVLAVLRHACLCVRVCFVCVFLPGWLVGPSHPSRRQRGQEAVQQPLESTV